MSILIIFGGLPGTGKTTISRKLAEKLSAVYLRIDTIETAIANSDLRAKDSAAGYLAAYAIAKDNLLLGRTVVADSVNGIKITRAAWREVAQSSGINFIEVEISCSDIKEHRTRVEKRVADIQGHKVPTWQEVTDNKYEKWDLRGIKIDSAINNPEQCVESILEYLKTNNLGRE